MIKSRAVNPPLAYPEIASLNICKNDRDQITATGTFSMKANQQAQRENFKNYCQKYFGEIDMFTELIKSPQSILGIVSILFAF